MSSGAAVRRAGLLSGTVGAVAACTAALLLAPGADAAPYPPTQPCVVTAALAPHRANVPRPGVVDVDVRGAGLAAGDTVSLTTGDGRTLARVRADAQGGFATVLTAPAPADGTTPTLAAVTARERCVSNPPGSSPGDGAAPAPGDTDPTSDGTGGTDGSNGSDGSGADDGPGASGASSPATAPSDPLSTDIAGSTGASTGASPGASTSATPSNSGTSSTGSIGSTGSPASTSVPPRADVPRGTGPSLGIGLAIAAALLVLGTLAVLLLTRRPEH